MAENHSTTSDTSDNLKAPLTPHDLIQWASDLKSTGKADNGAYDVLQSLPDLLYLAIGATLDAEEPRHINECGTALRILSMLYCKVEVALSQIQKDAEREAGIVSEAMH